MSLHSTIKENVSLYAAYTLIFLFVYTATSKVFAWDVFIETLKRSPLIGKNFLVVAVTVPILEYLTAGLLFFQLTRMAGLFSAVILLFGFTVYIGYMVLYVPHLPCSCGGVIKELSWRQHFVFNIAFMLVAMLGSIDETKKLSYRIHYKRLMQP